MPAISLVALLLPNNRTEVTTEHKGRWLAHIRPDLYPPNIRDARDYLLQIESERDRLRHDLEAAQATIRNAVEFTKCNLDELVEVRKMLIEVARERDGLKKAIAELFKAGAQSD